MTRDDLQLHGYMVHKESSTAFLVEDPRSQIVGYIPRAVRDPAAAQFALDFNGVDATLYHNHGITSRFTPCRAIPHARVKTIDAETASITQRQSTGLTVTVRVPAAAVVQSLNTSSPGVYLKESALVELIRDSKTPLEYDRQQYRYVSPEMHKLLNHLSQRKSQPDLSPPAAVSSQSPAQPTTQTFSWSPPPLRPLYREVLDHRDLSSTEITSTTTQCREVRCLSVAVSGEDLLISQRRRTGGTQTVALNRSQYVTRDGNSVFLTNEQLTAVSRLQNVDLEFNPRYYCFISATQKRDFEQRQQPTQNLASAIDRTR